jgi:hypothetical protein
MGRRSGGGAETQGNLDLILRRLIPVVLLVFALNALLFAVTGAPGVTDVAHLKAITLPFGRLIAWIAGAPEPDLVPAPLQTAPFPLLIDWLLWRISPIGVAGLKIAHVLLATAALWQLLRALAMRMDLRTAVIAGAIIALSPRFIEPVTNLGPDPIVFILFCWQLAILLTRGKIGGPEPLVLFTALGICSGLSGLSGMVAAATLFALLLFAASDAAHARQRARFLLVAILFWALPVALRLLDGPQADGLTPHGLVAIGAKLVAHNADYVLLPGAVLLIGGTAVLIALGLHCYVGRLTRNGPSERTHPFALLLFATVTGALLVVIAGPVLRLYLWTEPPAHAWLGLLVVLLAAACFTPRLVPTTESLRRIRRAAAAVTLAGALSGTIAYHYRADWFAAGPEAGLMRALEAAGPDRAIVYSGADWGRTYFPHSWLSPTDNEQWLLSLDGTSVQRIAPGGQPGEPQPLSALDGYEALVVTRIDRRGWRDLHAVRNSEAIGAMPPAALDAFPSYWQAEPAQAAPGEYWLTTQILRRPTSLLPN